MVFIEGNEMRIYSSKPLLGLVGIVLALAMALSGCGQKGDLYLPPEQQPKQYTH